MPKNTLCVFSIHVVSVIFLVAVQKTIKLYTIEVGEIECIRYYLNVIRIHLMLNCIHFFQKNILSLTGLNYRKLTDESLDPLASLEPVLTSQNVLSVSKLANRLPVPGGGGASVSPSGVHAVWLQKLFWKGDPQLLKRPPQSDQDYLHAYDTCAKYLDRLVPADAINFLDSITFSTDAAKHVSLNWAAGSVFP